MLPPLFPGGHYEEFTVGSFRLTYEGMSSYIARRSSPPPLQPPPTSPPPAAPPPPLPQGCRLDLANANNVSANTSTTPEDPLAPEARARRVVSTRGGTNSTTNASNTSTDLSTLCPPEARYPVIPPPFAPPPPLPTGLAALTQEERDGLKIELHQRIQSEAAAINAVEVSRRGKYSTIGGISIVYREAENSFAYSIYGACALVHRMMAWSERLNSSIGNLTLFIHEPVTCSLIEYGAPRPPPGMPPPPTPPPPLIPPSAPPASVPIMATISMRIDERGSLSPDSVATFADSVSRWIRLQAAAIGSSDYLVTVTEEMFFRWRATSQENSTQANLLERMTAVADSALCANTLQCQNTASLGCAASECTAGVEGRMLQAAVPNTPGPPQLPTSPSPPHPPASPAPPSAPPPAPPPREYEDVVTVETRRTRNAGSAQTELQGNLATLSILEQNIASSPLAVTHNITQQSSRLSELAADARVTAIAENITVANSLAASLFLVLLDTTSLRESLFRELQLEMDALLVVRLRAEYIHPEDGLIVIEGSLPPPPPMMPDLAPPIDSFSSDLTLQAEQDAIQAISTTVSIMVAGAVAASVATSVAGAVASSVASASAGAASGGAGGAAGSAGSSAAQAEAAGGGAMLPFVLGAQRFQASSGLAVNISNVQTGVAEGMPWILGDFNMSFWRASQNVTATTTASRRRLMIGQDENQTLLPEGDDADAQREALNELMSTLSTFAIVVGSILALTFSIQHVWRHRMNRRYYAEGRLSKKERRSLTRHARFRSLPAIFVFPGILMLSINFFTTGLIDRSIRLILAPGECGAECIWPAVAVLVLVGSYMIFIMVLLLHFNRYHRAVLWQPTIEPSSSKEIEDPLYRLVSKIRLVICRRGGRYTIMDRARGEFKPDEGEREEPDRTERLLAHPFSLVRTKAADSLDALKLTWMARASGGAFVGVSFDLVAMTVQVVITVTLCVGIAITKGSTSALVQVGAVMTLQLGTFLYVIMASPSNDRIENLLTVSLPVSLNAR